MGNSYLLVNPAAGNTYFDTAGSATTDTTQPKVDGGAAAMPGTTSARSPANLDGYRSVRSQETIYGSQMNDGVGTLTGSGMGVSAISTNNYATMVAGQYIMRRGGANTHYIAGTASNVLRSAASDYGHRRSVNARTTVRGPLTATAIVAGYWNISTASWSTAPTSSTDGLGNVRGQASATQSQTNATGADQAVYHPSGYDYPGELVFIAGNASTILIPNQNDYQKRTTN